MPTNNPVDAFLAHRAAALAALDALRAHADDHFGYGPDDLHWGHVGTAASIAARLAELAADLGLTPAAPASQA